MGVADGRSRGRSHWQLGCRLHGGSDLHSRKRSRATGQCAGRALEPARRYVIKLAPDGAYAWSHISPEEQRLVEWLNLLASSRSGEVVNAGQQYSAPDSLTPLPGIVVKKLDAGGRVAFRIVANGNGGERARACGIGTDALGNAYVAGEFDSNGFAFPGGPFHDSAPPMAQGDPRALILAKVDESGQHVWSRSFPGTRCGSSVASVDGSSVVSGRESATERGATFDNDDFVAKFDEVGELVWTQRAGLDGLAQHLALHRDERVVSVAPFSEPSTIGGAALTSAGETDIAVVMRDRDGNVLWARSFGGQGADEPVGVAAGSDGTSYVTGYFTPPADFGGGMLGAPGHGDGIQGQPDGSHLFLLRVDAAGKHLWSIAAEGPSESCGMVVASPETGSGVVLGGIFTRRLKFGGIELPSAGDLDVFVARLSL